MDNTKYVGMHVHKDTISVAVMNPAGKMVMESVLETKIRSECRYYPCGITRLGQHPPYGPSRQFALSVAACRVNSI